MHGLSASLPTGPPPSGSPSPSSSRTPDTEGPALHRSLERCSQRPPRAGWSNRVNTMDLLGKARRLESTIARRFDRAARDAVGAVTREPLEIVHLVVEAVAHEIQPGGRGKRVFPFNSITLSVLASSREERARFEAVLAGEPPLQDRIVEHLRSKSCAIDDLTLDVAYVARAPKNWRYPQFNLALARVARAPTSD